MTSKELRELAACLAGVVTADSPVQLTIAALRAAADAKDAEQPAPRPLPLEPNNVGPTYGEKHAQRSQTEPAS